MTRISEEIYTHSDAMIEIKRSTMWSSQRIDTRFDNERRQSEAQCQYSPTVVLYTPGALAFCRKEKDEDVNCG